jgi:hypothetical protein
MTEHIDPPAVPIPVQAPLNIGSLAGDDEGFPTFRADHFDEMSAYVLERLSSTGIDGVTIDPPTADDRPGRRLAVDGVTVCRVIGDPSDPRPFSTVALNLLRAAASTATA